jgi:hypothetical protein
MAKANPIVFDQFVGLAANGETKTFGPAYCRACSNVIVKDGTIQPTKAKNRLVKFSFYGAGYSSTPLGIIPFASDYVSTAMIIIPATEGICFIQDVRATLD